MNDMDGKLRNMAGVYITSKNKMLLLYRIGSRVVSPSWCNIGGHFEKEELNDAKAAMLREVNEEIGLQKTDILPHCIAASQRKMGSFLQDWMNSKLKWHLKPTFLTTQKSTENSLHVFEFNFWIMALFYIQEFKPLRRLSKISFL